MSSQTPLQDKQLQSNFIDSTPSNQENSYWQQLLESKSLIETVQNWLFLQCQQINGVECGIIVLKTLEDNFSPVAYFPQKMKDIQRFTQVIDHAIKDRKGVVLKNENTNNLLYHIGFPVQCMNQLYGAVVLEIKSLPQSQLQIVMRQLQWGMAWLENKILVQRTNENTNIIRSLSTAVDLTAVILQEEKFNAAATAFSTELATKLNCDRVSIGFIKKKRSKIVALSHSASYGKDTNLVRAIEEAMDECSDQQETINYPAKDDKNRQILLAHKKLALEQGNNAVCTIPFINQQGYPYGAITLERSGEKPFDSKVIEYCETVILLASPILLEKKNNEKLIFTRIFESIVNSLKTIIGAGHFSQKIGFACITALLIFFYFATGEFRVSANAVIEGSIQRAMVSPYSGYILDTYARAGDVISKDDLICKLDDKDLQLERLSWLSQKEQYQRQMREAMSTNNRARMNIITEQINQADAQVALLDEQISRSQIKAPFDGIVVTGDLSQSLGSPVERGEILFEMAPLDSYRVILKVEETDIDEIKANQEGSLLLTSIPDHPLPIKIKKITPVSTTESGKTYFPVEATLTELIPELRPGMEGFGKIQIERRKLIWIWTHDIINWIRIQLWSVIP